MSDNKHFLVTGDKVKLNLCGDRVFTVCVKYKHIVIVEDEDCVPRSIHIDNVREVL